MKINLKNIMELKGISMYKLCQDTGIAQSTISRIFNNKTTRIDFDTLESICRVLECTPNDIIIADDPKVSRLLAYEMNIRKMQESKGDTE